MAARNRPERQLKAELYELFTRRRKVIEEQGGFISGETREQLTKRIEEVRRELTTIRAQQASETSAQTVRIEQDLRTGSLVDGTAQPAGSQGVLPNEG